MSIWHRHAWRISEKTSDAVYIVAAICSSMASVGLLALALFSATG